MQNQNMSNNINKNKSLIIENGVPGSPNVLSQNIFGQKIDVKIESGRRMSIPVFN